MILMGIWTFAAVAWLTFGLVHYRAQLKRSTTRLALLSQINGALELEASELAGQAYTDSLTGALNREGLRDALMYKWRQTGPSQNAMAVVFVDLDHFKQINDTHGHAAEAQAPANKLREAIQGQIWPSGLRLTASFGVTALHHGEDIGDAIKRADGALYRAKANGRNCVEIA
jgi:GGDEF domain-containing protein